MFVQSLNFAYFLNSISFKSWFDPFGPYYMICACPCMFHNLYLSVHWSLLVNTAGNTSQIQQWNAEKRCRVFSKVNSEDARVTTSMFLYIPMSVRSLWCLFLLTLAVYRPWCSKVLIVEFQQVNTHWIYSDFCVG